MAAIASAGNVTIEGGSITALRVRDLSAGTIERFEAKVFVDATYEGDLAAAAGCEYRLGREGRDELGEEMAGRLYKVWGGPVGPGSTGQADNAIQAFNFLYSDLPEENWPWPTSGWDWRDRFARRLRDYTLGLVWFAQNDPAMPNDIRERCREWGLAKSEFADNDHFPRQAYVREGRRVVGEYWFTARDAVPARPNGRPPLHADSITASHYSLDSHAVRKREPGRVHLDGFFSSPSRPYTVPYGVIVPKRVDGLLTPVPVSGTHVGFSTLRMEPCWMALGEAAGEAAALCVERGLPPRRLPLPELQRRLLRRGAVLMYFTDVKPGDAHFEAIQFLALRGFVGTVAWKARPDEPATEDDVRQWCAWAGVDIPADLHPGRTTRGQLLALIDGRVQLLSPEEAGRVRAR